MIGPVAFDGPALFAANHTVPVAPGVIGVEVTATPTSAVREPTPRRTGATVLSAATGSVSMPVTVARPALTVPGVADAGTVSANAMVAVAPRASPAGRVQVSTTGPGDGPDDTVQPAGGALTVTAAVGVNVTVVGPVASEGPALVTTSTTGPEVPGVTSVGDDETMARLATRPPACTASGAR